MAARQQDAFELHLKEGEEFLLRTRQSIAILLGLCVFTSDFVTFTVFFRFRASVFNSPWLFSGLYGFGTCQGGNPDFYPLIAATVTT